MGVTRSLDAGRARGTAGLLFGRSASRPVLLLAPRVLAAMFVLLSVDWQGVCVCVFEQRAFHPVLSFSEQYCKRHGPSRETSVV